ncbi:MAG TPA: cbb3-type cytochrome c oxidase subunit I [candidate division Zixibacteria bacterium]|nr:cbb3-type cytochrome c oxidase subunit I [candidate division Zixibacteria bacterium]
MRAGREIIEKYLAIEVALYIIIGATLGNLLGAGVWGFIHTLPQINSFTHGTQITASHAHFTTPGTYLFLFLGFAYIAIPALSDRTNFSQLRGKITFWILVIGFLNMIIALLLAGIIQVQLQRISGMSFMEVQNILLPFYGWRTIGGVTALIGWTGGGIRYDNYWQKEIN